MALVEFQDNQAPYLNAENLNHNFNELKGTILYENSNGSSGAITLNDEINNYNFIEIFFKDVNGRYGSTKSESGNGIEIDISSFQTTTGNARILNRVVKITGNELIDIVNGYVAFNSNTRIEENVIFITKIIGY